MRPIEKRMPGEKVDLPFNHGSVIVLDDYNPHRKAHAPLVGNIGNYCSYCEVCDAPGCNLQVEHIMLQSTNPELVHKWHNFLLSCSNCNGPHGKRNKPVVFSEIHLPHLNNTFKSLVYLPGGVVISNPNLTDRGKVRADNLISLIGLDKVDERCDCRRQTWDKAVEKRKKYESGVLSLENLIEYIRVAGFWSVWFTVFRGIDEVREALLSFPGTARCCFDPAAGYDPIDRNPTDVSDPT